MCVCCTAFPAFWSISLPIADKERNIRLFLTKLKEWRIRFADLDCLLRRFEKHWYIYLSRLLTRREILDCLLHSEFGLPIRLAYCGAFTNIGWFLSPIVESERNIRFVCNYTLCLVYCLDKHYRLCYQMSRHYILTTCVTREKEYCFYERHDDASLVYLAYGA